MKIEIFFLKFLIFFKINYVFIFFLFDISGVSCVSRGVNIEMEKFILIFDKYILKSFIFFLDVGRLIRICLLSFFGRSKV